MLKLGVLLYRLFRSWKASICNFVLLRAGTSYFVGKYRRNIDIQFSLTPDGCLKTQYLTNGDYLKIWVVQKWCKSKDMFLLNLRVNKHIQSVFTRKRVQAPAVSIASVPCTYGLLEGFKNVIRMFWNMTTDEPRTTRITFTVAI